MRWDEGHESPDVVDRRGEGGGGIGSGLLAFAPIFLRSPFGLLLFLLIVVGGYAARKFGTDDQTATPSRPAETTGAQVEGTADRERHFVSFVLDDTQKTWAEIFAKNGRTYETAKLVLFTGATRTACGYGESAAGPFYCPSDEQVYIDLAFYEELAQRFGAKGDFAQAYVIAHEIGHHVQRQLGVAEALGARRRADREGTQSTSMRLELQADCYAGIWANSSRSRGLLEPGDVEEAMNAASAIGDDRLQKQARGAVRPESFTHGTAEQRARWFRTGLEGGRIEGCDTLHGAAL